MGAAVKTNSEKERGWREAYATSPQLLDCFTVPPAITVLEWHSETFAIPEHAIHFAQNDVCQNQIFQYHKNVNGFQFHPEVTIETLHMFLTLHEDIAKYQGPFVEPILKTLNIPPKQYHEGQALLNRAIDYVLENSKSQKDQLAKTNVVMA